MAKEWIAKFGRALESGDTSAASSMFADDCYWRDLVCWTWNILTCEGKGEIKAMLDARLKATGPSNWEISSESTGADGVTEAWFTFETILARCNGVLRLKEGRCWIMLTTMQELKGYEEKRGPTRPAGVVHGAIKGRRSWLELKAEEESKLGHSDSSQPYVLIVGGGQCGIALAARLKMLNVPAIIIERNARPGDSWRRRYRTLCLHDPIWFDHLPYLPFPDHWPVFIPKDKMGDWLEAYTSIMELNYWGSTACTHAAFDDSNKEWVITVERHVGPASSSNSGTGHPGTGSTPPGDASPPAKLVLRPKHLVIATGMSGFPNIPSFPGKETFLGEQCHSSQFTGEGEYAGKKCVVLGANTSAHDICAALWEQGAASVTMVQRSPSLVAKSETLFDVTMSPLYSEKALAAGISVDKADMILGSLPYRVMPFVHMPLYEEIQKRDAEFYKQLAGAGFLLDWGEDASGLFMKYIRRASGYYIDVGASEMIIDGRIGLKSGVNIAAVREKSVVLTDGTELPADILIYATGYSSMNDWVAQLISPQVADKVGKCWGVGSGTAKDPGPWEGELRNMWKPTAQEGLWFQGGNLYQSRQYSLYLALQLKARHEGLPDVEVYGMKPVHHLR
eukprot:jgi/Mesvir1/20496/Mv12382-RA.1